MALVASPTGVRLRWDVYETLILMSRLTSASLKLSYCDVCIRYVSSRWKLVSSRMPTEHAACNTTASIATDVQDSIMLHQGTSR
jgi:hypothetical protein